MDQDTSSTPYAQRALAMQELCRAPDRLRERLGRQQIRSTWRGWLALTPTPRPKAATSRTSLARELSPFVPLWCVPLRQPPIWRRCRYRPTDSCPL